jgi:hypothetical protein
MSVGLGLPESDCHSRVVQLAELGIRVRRNRLREIRCPKLARPKDAGRERRKLAKRQEVAEAKERESALRSRREQLVKGALNPRTKRAVRLPPKDQRSQRARQSPEVREPSGLRSSYPVYFHACLLHAAARVVCCILFVASVPCCALVAAYNASRMLLVLRCPPHTKRGGAVGFLLHLACARVLLNAVSCLLSVVCCNALPVPHSRLFAL